MKTIYKFPIESPDDTVHVKMPRGSIVLSVQEQHGVPCIWAIADTEQPVESRRFHVRGTGHPLGDVGRFIGTFQLSGGALVFHLFGASTG